MKSFFALIAIATSLSFNLTSVEFDTSNHPTIGSADAPVEVVAFLEPKCPDSKRYSNESFPKLKKEFIDTNKVKYTVITVSFLSESMPAAIALLCVYNQNPQPNPELFLSYLDYIYRHQPPERQNWATLETLQKFANETSTSIDQNKLKNCIENHDYQAQIEKNTTLGNQIMGKVSTPTLYVNGIPVENKDDTVDYEKLKEAIQKALSKE